METRRDIQTTETWRAGRPVPADDAATGRHAPIEITGYVNPNGTHLGDWVSVLTDAGDEQPSDE